jgi:hypothetical protein
MKELYWLPKLLQEMKDEQEKEEKIIKIATIIFIIFVSSPLLIILYHIIRYILS